MPRRAHIGPLPAWLPITGVAVAALASSPAIFDLIGWSHGRDLARFDPVLSLCLASRPEVQPENLWASWSLAPQIVLPLLLVILLYGWGVLAVRRTETDPPKPAQLVLFGAGMILLALALLSPLCRLAATLAWVHMIQHVLIVAVVPPLLLMSQPLMTMRQGLGKTRSPAARLDTDPADRWLDRPALASGLYGAAIWLSHTPAVYEAALLDPTIHLLLLAFQLAAGLLFWRIIVRGVARPEGGREGGQGAALLMAFSTFMHTGLLGALLTFASTPWYPIYGLRSQAWGLSPLEDQQLAGLIMWVPMNGIFLAAGLAVMAQLLKLQERRPS